MGAPPAGRLLPGNQVDGTNRTRATAAAPVEAGLSWRDTPREVAAAPRAVFSMVTDDAALAASAAAQLRAVSDGLLLAESGGIDEGLAAETMTGPAIGSAMLRARAVLDLPEQARFDVQLMHKDIRLALGSARESTAPLPAASAADSGPSRAEELGYGHRDIAALFPVLAAAAGSPPNPAGAGPEAA